jgi:hypothetical protein
MAQEVDIAVGLIFDLVRRRQSVLILALASLALNKFEQIVNGNKFIFDDVLDLSSGAQRGVETYTYMRVGMICLMNAPLTDEPTIEAKNKQVRKN